PPPVPAAVVKLIAQLDDDDEDVRKEAIKKLTAMGESVVAVLRRTARTHADTDVRLRARVILAAIEKKLYGEVRRFTGHKGAVITFALSPDGKQMVSGSSMAPDRDPIIWNVGTGKEVRRLKGHTGTLYATAWSKDGKNILTGGTDNVLNLWEAKSGNQLKSMVGHYSMIYAVVFTPDGKKAVSCGNELPIYVWDLEDRKLLKRISGHRNAVRSLAMMPDGKSVLTASFDGTV